MKEQIKSCVSDKDVLDVELPFVRVGDITKFLTKEYGCETDNFETNGWEWDFWLYVIIEDTKYCISGDGYYNPTIYFQVESE